MPLAGADALLGDVRPRQLRRDRLLWIEAFDHAVNDPLRAEIFRTIDAERKFRRAAVLDHVLGQEVLRTETEISAAVVRDDVHRRRADKCRDKEIGGVVVDFCRRPHLTNLSLVDDGDAVTHAHRLDLVVGHVDGGEADALLKLPDLLAGRGAQFGVEVRKRLVEQQRGRLTHQRARERDALTFSAGQLARPPVEKVADAEQLRGPLDLLVDFGARNALRAQRKGDVLAHRVMRIEAVALKHHRHAAGAGRHLVDDVAADQKIAAGLRFEPADDPQERRLAAARWAEQHHELPVRHRQADSVDGRNSRQMS